MLLNVTFAVASRQNIRRPAENSATTCPFLNGNGTKLKWTSSLVFPDHRRVIDAIFVVVDRFSKVAHFLPVKETITASQLADLYVSRIVSLHGIPLEINSDHGSLFTSRFWESFQLKLWELTYPLAQLFTPSPVVKLNESTKFSKICFELVSSHLARNGRNLSRMLNFHTTIAIKLA